MTPIEVDLLIKNIAELATPVSTDSYGPAELSVLTDAAIAVREDEIFAVGSSSDIEAQVRCKPGGLVIAAATKTVTPGLVDCHTHPVFNGTREHEFEMRVQGKSYEEIAQAGGGIRSSVRNLRGASKEELLQQAIPRLDTFLRHGTTTIEAKSGYGLTVQDEIKMLEVIRELDQMHALDIIPTFLGAHEIPDEYRSNRAGYIELVIKEMLPRVRDENLAEFCDVFCESHVFSVKESQQILQAATDLGYKLKIHSEQLSRLGGTSMASGLGATSADHLDYTEESDWRRMAERGVIPVLLPGAVYFLGKKKYASARSMIEAKLPVALATDLNPGSCMTESLPIVMNLACLMMAMTPAETLAASTYHAALAIARGNLFGTIEVGKKADLVIWDAPNHKHIPYHFGVNLVAKVIKGGKVVHDVAGAPVGSREETRGEEPTY